MQEVSRANLVRASFMMANTAPSSVSNSAAPSVCASNTYTTPTDTPRGHGDDNHPTQANTQNDHTTHAPQKSQMSKFAPQRPDEAATHPTQPVGPSGKVAVNLISGIMGSAGKSIGKVGASIIGGEKSATGLKSDNTNKSDNNVMRTTNTGTGTGTGVGAGPMKMTPSNNNSLNSNSNSAPQRRPSHNTNTPHSVSTTGNNTVSTGSNGASTGTKNSTLPSGVVMRSTASLSSEENSNSSTSAKPDSIMNKFSSFFGGK